MRPHFFDRPRLTGVMSALLLGAFAVIGSNARADVTSWVSTSAPDVTPDPSATGSFNTQELEYSVGATATTIGKHGILVAPTDAFAGTEAVKRPVVVFLHGQHANCVDTSTTPPATAVRDDYLNCPVANRVLNYRGYLYIQRRLASLGYISISIDANELLNDGSKMNVAPNAHLSLLKDWTDPAKAPNSLLLQVAQNVDFNKVVLVGHSIGASAVNHSAYENKTLQASGTPPFWKVAGQVLISGYESPIASSLGVHTLNWLSECDNVNSTAQSILDTDIHHDFVTLRSAVLVRGANHNYSNSVWTDDDDDYGNSAAKTGLECRLKDELGQPNPIRLAASAQQAVARAYVATAVAAFVSNDANAWKAIDGTPARLPSSGASGTAGPEIRVSGKGRRRIDFVQISPATSNVVVSNTGIMSAKLCTSTVCKSDAGFIGAQGAQFWVGNTSDANVVAVTWSALGATVTLTHNASVDGGLLGVLPSHYQLGLRIAQMPSTGAAASQAITMNIKIKDKNGQELDLGKATVKPLVTLANTGPIWAQEIRLPVPLQAGFDYNSIVSLDMTPVYPSATSGQFWVADAFGYYAP
jgi:hypothetical protein